MKTKFLLLTVLTLLFILAACKPQSEPQSDINTTPGSRADQNGTIYVSHVKPADQTIYRLPSTFVITFPFPMDQDSVEAALQITPEVDYSTRWNNNDLVITFKEGAQFREYTVSLASPIESIEGEVFPPTSWIVNFQLPTATPTHTPTATFTPTIPPTPTPTIDPSVNNQNPLFYSRTRQNYLSPTTTPIPTPQVQSSEFTLAEFTIVDYIELIRTLDTYATENDTEQPVSKRPAFINNQRPIKMIVEEALLAYPDTPYTEDLYWKLALTNAILGVSDSDEWILNQIENSLNQSLFSPTEINRYLNQHGFEVEQEFTVTNLFGDNKTTPVLIINSTHDLGTSDGIIAVLRGDASEAYQLILAASIWDFDSPGWASMGECETDIIDLNQNGIPEICLIFDFGRLPRYHFLEWQEDQFINLSNLFVNGRVVSLEISPPDLPGIDVAIPVYDAFETKVGEYHYIISGDAFELVSVEYDYLLDQIAKNFYTGEFSAAVEIIEDQLSAGPPYKKFDFGMDSLFEAGTDTLRLLLGLAYAYNSDVESAREVFLSLAQQPTRERYPIFSQIAQEFVNLYYDDIDLYRACDAAMEILQTALSTSDADRVYGYSIGYSDPIPGFLSRIYTITLPIKAIPTSITTELPDTLRNAGFHVIRSQPFDALNNGYRDWAIMINIPGGQIPVTVLAIQYQGKWVAEYIIRSDNYTTLNVDLLYLENLTYPAVVVMDGDETHIYELLPEENTLVLTPLLESLADIYYFDQIANQPVLVTSDHIISEWIDWDGTEQEDEFDMLDVYTWDPEEKIYAPYEGSVLDEPEAFLDYLRIITNQAASYPLALAYELLGDTTNAIQTYWRVWTEYPDTPYAIMARAKLEPVSP